MARGALDNVVITTNVAGCFLTLGIPQRWIDAPLECPSCALVDVSEQLKPVGVARERPVVACVPHLL